eukprot:12955008-Ditylum_brightwellii.AAC.1
MGWNWAALVMCVSPEHQLCGFHDAALMIRPVAGDAVIFFDVRLVIDLMCTMCTFSLPAKCGNSPNSLMRNPKKLAEKMPL